MSLGKRHARHHLAVDATIWWDFQPGERVQTKEGIPGYVVEVQDGPYPGNEAYIVELENGLGGGAYSSSELAPINQSAASSQQVVDTPSTQASIVQADVTHTAADDYPELGTILNDRPPLGDISVTASRSSDDGEEESHKEAGIFNQLFLGPAERVNNNLPEEFAPGPNGQMWSYDWCRFRKKRHCYYPKELDAQGTE
jgi:hypothetical protein